VGVLVHVIVWVTVTGTPGDRHDRLTWEANSSALPETMSTLGSSDLHPGSSAVADSP
jgi:hypothetical protein